MFRGLEAPQRAKPQLSLRKRWISYSSLGTGAPGGGIQVLGVLFKSKGREELVTDIDSDANVVPVWYIMLEIKITTLGLYDYGQNNYDYFEQDWNHDYFLWLLIYFYF